MNLLPSPHEGQQPGDDEQAAGHGASHDADGDHGPRRTGRGGGRRKATILSKEQCLEALSSLPRLLTMDAISPQKANALRGILQTLLGAHQGRQSGPSGGADRANIRNLLREHPEAANLFVGLLTDEEINSVLESLRGEEPEATGHGN